MKTAVLLATYNSEKYINELLDSLEAQSDSDFVICVHDDGSRDLTPEILKARGEKAPEKYNILTGEPTGSAKANFMWMLAHVEADYYFFADHDDVWLPNKIERCRTEMQQLEASAHVATPLCVFTDMYVVDKELNILSDSFIRYIGRSYKRTAYSQMMVDNPAAGCCMMFNRALRDIAVSPVDINGITMHDHFVVVLGALCGIVKGIDEPLIYYRQTGENEVGASTESKAQKVKRNLSEILDRSAKEKKTAFLSEAKSLAAELIKVPAVPEDKKIVLKRLINIDNEPKSERIKFYKDYDFTRLSGNTWMRLWV